MKTNTFFAFSLTAVVGISAALFSMNADASERYMHHCSVDKSKPTLIKTLKPLGKFVVSVETRKFFPGVNPKTRVISLSESKRLYESRFLVFVNKKLELKRCFFRNQTWTVAKAKK